MRNSEEEFLLKQLFHLTYLAVNQIAKTVQWLENCWNQSSEEGPDATENWLGGSWVSHVPLPKWNENSRYVDERPHRYHRWHTGVFVGASPVCIPGTPCMKLIDKRLKHRNLSNRNQKFYIYLDVTHTHTIFHTKLCHTLSFTHNFHTHHLSHTTLLHTHTPSFLVTHHLSHTTLSHTTLFYFSILHDLLCLSFFPRPLHNIWCSLLEEVALWGYLVL